MQEAFNYISSEFLVNQTEEYCSSATCRSRQHGYTCKVETESQSQSFAIIKEGAEDTYVYYDTKAATKRTELHPEQGQEYDVDHVSKQIIGTKHSPNICEYLKRNKERLIQNRKKSPDVTQFGSWGIRNTDNLYDKIFNGRSLAPEDEIRDTFDKEVEQRRQRLNSDDGGEGKRDQFQKMFGWRIEPLVKYNQPDIVLELILLGAYEQVNELI